MNDRNQQRWVEYVGFLHGTQGTAPEHEQAQLEAQVKEQEERVKRDAVDSVQRLEAREVIVARQHAEAATLWVTFRDETGGRVPNFVLPKTVMLLATVLLFGEVFFLSPMMDGLGIANPFGQFLIAAIIVLSAGFLAHLCQQQLLGESTQSVRAGGQPQKQGKSAHLIGTVLLTVLTFSLIFILGRWRAVEMVFLAGGKWGEFLRLYEGLTVSLVTLLTIALPIVAAVALDWAIEQSYYARLWRRAKHDDGKLHSQLETVRKQRAAVVQKREHEIQMVRQHGCRLLSAYHEFYDLGQHIGARRPPLYLFALKVMAFGLLLIVGCILVDLFVGAEIPGLIRLALYTVLVLALVATYSHRVFRLWERPTPSELYHWRGIRWRPETEPAPQHATTESRRTSSSLRQVLRRLQQTEQNIPEGA